MEELEVNEEEVEVQLSKNPGKRGVNCLSRGLEATLSIHEYADLRGDRRKLRSAFPKQITMVHVDLNGSRCLVGSQAAAE